MNRRRWSLVAVLAVACAGRSVPPRQGTGPNGAPPATNSGTSPAGRHDVESQCKPSRFDTTEDGIIWMVGDVQVPLVVSQTPGEHNYNYTSRTVRIEAANEPEVFLEASCYTETDCGAPADADGDDRWCLVSHGLVGAATWFPLFAEHQPCESPLDLLETLAVHSPSPTCFRVAIPTYPGALYETTEPYDQMTESGVPAAVVTMLDGYAKAAADADRGHDAPEDNAKARKALRDLRAAIAPYTDTKAAWALDLLAARALARVEKRYPYTLVGKGNRYYDVLRTDGVSWDVRETAAPWTDRSSK